MFYEPKAPLTVEITCHGWDAATQTDTLLDEIDVGVWLHKGGSSYGREVKSFKSPEELWNFFQEFATDPMLILKRDFNHTSPKQKGVLPKNLGDLFK